MWVIDITISFLWQNFILTVDACFKIYTIFSGRLRHWWTPRFASSLYSLAALVSISPSAALGYTATLDSPSPETGLSTPKACRSLSFSCSLGIPWFSSNLWFFCTPGSPWISHSTCFSYTLASPWISGSPLSPCTWEPLELLQPLILLYTWQPIFIMHPWQPLVLQHPLVLCIRGSP